MKRSAVPEARFGPEPVRRLARDDARRDDDDREHEKDRARSVHAQLSGVQRGEGAETREAEDREREHEPRPHGRRMDETRTRRCFIHRSSRHRLRKREADRGRDETEPRGEKPDRNEAIGAEHELAEERAEREPAPQAEAVQAQRFAAALLRGEVRDHRGGADEEHRLAEPREQTERDEQLEGARERVRRDAHGRDQRTGDDENAASLPVSDATCDRLGQEDHRADGTDGEGDAEASHSELVVRVHGQDHEEHPDRHAHRELREHGEDERLRQDAIGLHATDPSRTTPVARLLEAARAPQRARGAVRGSSRGRSGGGHRGGHVRGSRARELEERLGRDRPSVVVVARACGTRLRALPRPLARRASAGIRGDANGVPCPPGRDRAREHRRRRRARGRTGHGEERRSERRTAPAHDGGDLARERHRVRSLLLGPRRRRSVRACAARALDSRLPIRAGRDTATSRGRAGARASGTTSSSRSRARPRSARRTRCP